MKHKKIILKQQKDFSETEKHSIIRELIETKCTKVEIWKSTQGKRKNMGNCFAGCDN